MMQGRERLVVLVLLVIPAVGFGEWEATIDLNVGGSHIIHAAPGESFVMTVGLDSNQPVGGIQFALSVNGGADNALFQGSFDAMDLGSYGSLFSPPFPIQTNLFQLSEMTSQMAAGPVSLDGLVPELIFRGTGYTGQDDVGIFPGSLLHYTITMPQVFDHYEISVTDVILTNDQGNIVPDVISLITPEPASGLLLLAAVPFLRRWRG